MKRFIVFFIAVALFGACSTQEMDFQTPIQDDVVFYASFEEPSDIDTKVYANEDLHLRWTADDRVSIFNKNTYNQQYAFTGMTGDNSGGFQKVESDEFVTGNAISNVVSVYPYQASTKISEEGGITVTLPSEQMYAENTFGLCANTMVSVSEDNFLQYKNVGGYLMLKLYGEGVTVTSITLRGNSGEILAGTASVTMPLDGVPSVELANDGITGITLTCKSPVQLSATEEDYTPFWFVIPPVTFEKGFTIIVNTLTGPTSRATTKSFSIARNKLSKMSPLEVDYSIPNNCIFYTSKGEAVITPGNPDAFGAAIISNEYHDGFGIITFDGDVTVLGDNSFWACHGLTSITIPNSVTSIGDYAFCNCHDLTSITIPNSVTSIGVQAFAACHSLTSMAIPNSVTSIGNEAFANCSGLTSMAIPDSVTSIGDRAFASCQSLTSISIPNNVTSIGKYAFENCINLTSITIPDSWTSIGDYVFAACQGLTSITIPNSVTSIGNHAFSGCSSLTSITIPDSVKNIGMGAFDKCSALTSFSGRYASPDGKFLVFQGCLISVALSAIEGALTIPENVTSIGDNAFERCQGLTSITIPNSVTSIGDYAFASCLYLSNVTIPDCVTFIGIGAFNGCKSLPSVLIPSGVTNIESLVFGGCIKLTNIILPENLISIGYCAFYNCKALPSISIPKSVTSIGYLAFSSCSSLTSITIPESVTSIGYSAFSSCSSLASIIVMPETPPSVESPGRLFYKSNDCPIYVPEKSVDAYKTAQYWSEYADRIYAKGTPMAIDLGLPSGIKWASFNLGASKPEEYGEYYAWGEIAPKEKYDLTTYKWCSGSNTSYTKYCLDSSYGSVDNKTILDLSDDAAYLSLGGKWRMPTSEEWTELQENCNCAWTEHNGVKGCLVQSKINNNSIFLPAAGLVDLTDHKYQEQIGFYWSSTLDETPYGSGIRFEGGAPRWNRGYRLFGESIRPVFAE